MKTFNCLYCNEPVYGFQMYGTPDGNSSGVGRTAGAIGSMLSRNAGEVTICLNCGKFPIKPTPLYWAGLLVDKLLLVVVAFAIMWALGACIYLGNGFQKSTSETLTAVAGLFSPLLVWLLSKLFAGCVEADLLRAIEQERARRSRTV